MAKATTRPGLTPGAARRESRRAKRERAAEILRRMKAAYPNTRLALDFRSPLELLVATILAAQCTDKKINEVTPELFRRLPTARALGEASLDELEVLVKSTGFFRNKAKALQALGQALVADHGERVPETMEELTGLPGVGRKTANVVLGNAFGKPVGVAVDTHVQRLSKRLGLTEETDPEKIERDLMELLPQEDWTRAAHLLQDHGRAVCLARKPQCERCGVNEICPSAEF
ncbi:MAG TPA: endonuclease III [Thermoanaerobaculia bacterium]|jgi:endonuclease-3|nr:endonuclease III [Thermoanaerobaculia bacterium]